ncbi:uncharacterized protein LOC130719713 [Lotus japonicus]|uniref:uncharacterized protein LOC130719713 n=1 Tax=Lotus japonicus TaxID=34305 RepID=UPI00258D58D1|nr:uncharacterized protein LOC130719713 [Lotus japonicus]
MGTKQNTLLKKITQTKLPLGIYSHSHLTLLILDQTLLDPKKSRSWTLIEEENLMNILQELVVEGQKQPNGKFKAGAHETTVQRMRARMQGIDITSKHVVNKLKRWNAKYVAVFDMINTSGFGWDEARKCAIVDSPEVLQQYLAHHSRAQNVVNKPYPEFEKMQIIFGKDRADGHIAESFVDAVENTKQENDLGNGATQEESEIPINSPPPVSAPGSSSVSRASKKRARENDRLIACVEAFATSVATANNNMTMVAQRFAPPNQEHDLVADELKKMNLTRVDRIEETIKIAKCPTLTGLFLKMDGEDRDEFVNNILTDSN